MKTKRGRSFRAYLFADQYDSKTGQYYVYINRTPIASQVQETADYCNFTDSFLIELLERRDTELYLYVNIGLRQHVPIQVSMLNSFDIRVSR